MNQTRQHAREWRRIHIQTPLIGCPDCGTVVAELDREKHDRRCCP